MPTDGAKGCEKVVEHAASVADNFDATFHAISAEKVIRKSEAPVLATDLGEN